MFRTSSRASRRAVSDPANGYYGGVSYVPQTLVLALTSTLHARIGWSALDVASADGTLTPAGYHLIRGSQALVAALAVLATYSLARRLTAPETALAATALLAVSPRLIHAGAIFKPDVELLAATLLALLCSWFAAARAPHTGRYLLAGAAIGLAVGAKLNGVTAAAPLVLATALRWREWGRWPRLSLAGAASFVAYLLFNPDLAQVLRSLAKNQQHYDLTATGGWRDVLAETLTYPFDPSFHGPVIALLAVAGMTALAAAALAWHPADPGLRLGWWMLLAYPPIYYAVYVAASPRAKPNHFLQIVPFGALFAAVALIATGHALLGGVRRPWRLVTAGLLAVLAIGIPAASTAAEVYELVVPTTWELAKAWIERGLPEPTQGRRIVTLGGELGGGPPRASAYEALPADAEAARRALDDADGIVVASTALREGSDAAAVLQRVGPHTRHQRFGAGPFHARGEPVAALLNPFPAPAHPAAGRLVFRSAADGALAAPLPAAIDPGTLISIRLRLRLGAGAASDLRLRAGGEDYGWSPGPASGGDTFFLSRRFAAPPAGVLRVSLREGRLQDRANGELFVWGPR